MGVCCKSKSIEFAQGLIPHYHENRSPLSNLERGDQRSWQCGFNSLPNSLFLNLQNTLMNFGSPSPHRGRGRGMGLNKKVSPLKEVKPFVPDKGETF